MRKIWLTFKADLRRATSNTVGVLVVIGLVLIPGLFSWFNIAASWDPFANIGNLTFAIASTDKGYKSDLVPLTINVGDQVSATLLKDKQFNWVYTSKADAIDGTESGKYYAAVVIPSSFSKDMMTFFDPAAHHAKLAYYTNEKKNALAPKLTGEGVDAVAQQVNQAFSKILGEVALTVVSNLSRDLDSADTVKLVKSFDERLATLSGHLRSAAAGTGAYTALIDSADALADSSAALLGGGQALNARTEGKQADSAPAGGQQERQALDSATGSVQSLKAALDSAAGSLSDAIAQSAGGYANVAADVNNLFDSLNSQAGDSAASLKALATKVGSQIADYSSLRDKLQKLQDTLPSLAADSLKPLIGSLDDVIAAQGRVRDALTEAAAKIGTAAADSASRRQAVIGLVNQAKTSIDKLRTDYDQGLGSQLSRLSGQISSTVSSSKKLATSLDSVVADLRASSGPAADSLADRLSRAKGLVGDVSTGLTEAADRLDGLRGKITDALEHKDMSKLQEIIGSDPGALAATLASPVSLSRRAVFPVTTFGAAMTPLYLILPLWVGALLMGVSIRTEADRRGRKARVGTDPSLTLAADVSHETLLDGRGDGQGTNVGKTARRLAVGRLGSGRLGRRSDARWLSDLTLSQAYLARFASFALISLLQSTVAALGCLFLMRVPVAHPLLFLATAWLTGLVFALIIYTLILSFGSAGKALSVLLLVIQISGAGGAYPLQTLPSFFQDVSPFLPATHAINALRAAIAGIYNGDYWLSMGQLALFIVPALLLGLLLRKPLIAMNRRFVTAVEGTKLI